MYIILYHHFSGPCHCGTAFPAILSMFHQCYQLMLSGLYISVLQLAKTLYLVYFCTIVCLNLGLHCLPSAEIEVVGLVDGHRTTEC